MPHFLRSVTIAVLFAFGLASPTMAAMTDDARAFVDTVAGTALRTLQDSTLADDGKRDTLNALFSKSVDIEYVARFVLGRYWRTATPAQQKDYLAAYEPFLIRNYVSRIERYSGQTYKLTDSKPMQDGANVSMVLHTPDGSSPDVIVTYRLVKRADGFKVIDIVVEGVSLLNTQRSEFASVVSNHGIDYLIDALRKRGNK